jgi:hypothetical protein
MVASFTPDKTLIESHIRGLIEGNPTSVEFNGVTVQSIKSTVLRSDQLVAAGLSGRYLFSLLGIKSDFGATYPIEGEVVVVAGTNRRVLKVSIDDFDIGIRIDVGSEFEARAPLVFQ